QVTVAIEQSHQLRSLRRLGICALVVLCALAMFASDVTSWLLRLRPHSLAKKAGVLLLALATLSTAGCWRPFEPVQLETISPNEEAFLLPLTEDVKKQAST